MLFNVRDYGDFISSASLKSMVLTTITTAQIRNNTASNTDTTFTSVTGLDESGNSWANH